jgi:hypothetical protein
MLYMPAINVSPSSTDVRVTDNITHAINGFQGQHSWHVGSNLLIQNLGRLANRPGVHYSRVFQGGGELGDPGRLDTWTILPGGIADHAELGSSLLTRPGSQ